MADTPQPFRPVEPLQQVEQAVSLNQRVERNKDQSNQRERHRRRGKPNPPMPEDTTENGPDFETGNPAKSDRAEDHIDFRA